MAFVKESNNVPGTFFRPHFRVQYLSLRYNNITDKGAELLGVALGTPQLQNTKLLNLNLNGNTITDAGVAHLAKVCMMIT